MNKNEVTAILASLSLGALASVFLQSILQNRGKVFEQEFSFKEKRYQTIVMLTLAYLDPKNELHEVKKRRSPDYDYAALKQELGAEYIMRCSMQEMMF